MKKIAILILLSFSLIFVFTACVNTDAPGEKGQEIISAEKAIDSISNTKVVLVDAQNSKVYTDGHVEGAVNISRNDITTFGPFPTMLASADDIAEVLGENGISNNSTVLIYDNNNNMDAARLWWTMKVFGHEDVQVISGGLNALKKAGAEITTTEPSVSTVDYNIEEKNEDMLAEKELVKDQVDNPDNNVVLLDVRTNEEYNSGTIPGSIHFNYEYNNYQDGTYRPVRQIHTLYKDLDITPDKTIILYCKTSIRAAQTYLALYNAGYRDLKIYDGAWVEWSSDTSLPVHTPDGNISPNSQDGS
ncbi:MAG: sulfurtransferase [bacterium]